MPRFFVLLALIAAACASKPPPVIGIGGDETAQWRRFATDFDRERLRAWRDTWQDALPRARAANAPALAQDAALFDADRAMGDAMPPAGSYRCRTWKLGMRELGTRDFATGRWEECRIDQGEKTQALQVLSGPQRPAGLLFTDTDARAIFLGSMVFGDETAPLQYGTDEHRDLAGYVERIGERRWRLVMPQPGFEAMLEVIEIIPS